MITPKYLATGLRLGLIESSQIQDWVNEQIQASDEPSQELIELAYSKGRDLTSMYSILNGMTDETEEYDAVRRLLGEIEPKKLESINFCWRLTECLYSIWGEHNYSAPDDLGRIGKLEEEYRMATNGTFGTVEEWHNNFKIFIKSLE